MRVPQYEQKVGPATVQAPQKKFASPVEAAFGGQVAQAITHLGETGTKIAKVMQAHIEERQRQKDDADMASYDVQYRKALQDQLISDQDIEIDMNGNKVSTKSGKLLRRLGETAGSTKELRDWHISESERIIEKTKNPEIKAKLRNRFENLYMDASERVVSHEASEGRKAYVQALESNLALDIADSVTYDTPEKLNLGILHAVQTQDKIDDIKSFDDATKKNNNIKTASSVVLNSALGVLENTGSIDKALEFIDTEVNVNGVKTSAKTAIGESAYSGIESDLKAVAKKMKAESDALIKQGIRDKEDELNTAFLNDTLTLDEIYESSSIIGGKKAGALKKKLLSNQKLELKDIKVQSKDYVTLIDALISDDVDNYGLKSILVDAYADGTVDSEEAKQLSEMKKTLEDLKFNASRDVFSNSLRAVKNYFGYNNKSDYELKTALKKMVSYNQDVKRSSEEMKVFTDALLIQEAQKKYPELMGKQPGDIYTNKAGVSFKFEGLNEKGYPMFKEIK